MAQLILYGIFFTLVGACVGSFLNVVIWRLPHRGREVSYQNVKGKLTLSWPPSHCPVCDAPIPWYLNIPVVAYIALGARCAKCKVHIPIRYPLVELACAVLWGGMYLIYFVAKWHEPHGIVDLETGWAPFVLHLIFASALLAASGIDADIYQIPLEIPWMLAILAFLTVPFLGPPFLPGLVNRPGCVLQIIPHVMIWDLAKPAVGAAVGLILANVLLAFKILPRSFEFLAVELANEEASDEKKKKEREEEAPFAPPPKLTRYLPVVIAGVVILAGAGVSWFFLTPRWASLVVLCAAILVFLLGVLPRDAGQVDVTDEVMDEIKSPHVRREIMKEVLFLAIPLAAAALAAVIPWDLPQEPWLDRLLGSVLGFLMGAGVVWLIRILGSLWKGMEAMGMGDAHLMAGVGAVIGWPLVLVAFFTAPFVAILWAIVLKCMGKPNILPFGPWLAIASILMLFLGELIISFLLPGLC